MSKQTQIRPEPSEPLEGFAERLINRAYNTGYQVAQPSVVDGSTTMKGEELVEALRSAAREAIKRRVG